MCCFVYRLDVAVSPEPIAAAVERSSISLSCWIQFGEAIHLAGSPVARHRTGTSSNLCLDCPAWRSGAIRPRRYPSGSLFGGVVLLWVSGFDILYACQDASFDQREGLQSIPARFGVRGALRIARVLHFLMWIVAFGMTFWAPQLSLGTIFRVALLGVGGLLVYEHSVVSEKSLDRMQLAFFQLNSIISVVFLGAGVLDATLR